MGYKYSVEGLKKVRCPECDIEVPVNKKGIIIKHTNKKVPFKMGTLPPLCSGVGVKV